MQRVEGVGSMVDGFAVRVRPAAHGVARVSLLGEVDMAVLDRLVSGLLDALHANGVRLLEIELSGLRFIDACGISGLLVTYNDAQARGKNVRIRGVSGQPLWVLEIAGVLSVLDGKSSPEDGAGDDHPA